MSSEKLVSVLIPLFNAKKFVLEALNSVEKQTYRNLQIIIIDDGSTDGSSDICKDWCAKHHRFEYHYQKNGGISSALNTGLKLARGNYIARMDADDKCMPFRISKQVAFLRDNLDIDIVSSSYLPFNKFEISKPVIHPSDDRVIALLLSYCSPVCHPGVLARANVFNKFKYKDNPVAEDYELWCRLVSEHKISNIKDILLEYRQHNLSSTLLKLNKIRYRRTFIGLRYFFLNYKLFHSVKYAECLEELKDCRTIKKWPALFFLSFAKLLMCFRK